MGEETRKRWRYLFGPVASRRFGRSLGVDMLRGKTCACDCVYCQLGPTARPTSERREWVATGEVVEEIAEWFEADGGADVVTFAGSGEPTLHTGLGRAIGAAKEAGDLPTVVLTFGALLHLPEVRADLCLADIVKVTLSAADEDTWRAMHRPAAGLRFENALEGLGMFRQQFRGRLWIEAMLVEGVNADVDRVGRLGALCACVGADLVQLNTPVRPSSARGVRAVSRERMEDLSGLFPGPVEIIGEARRDAGGGAGADEDAILDVLLRHPCDAANVAASFGIGEEEALEILEGMVASGTILAERENDRVFYRGARTP